MQYLQTNAEDCLSLICCFEIFRTFIIHNFMNTGGSGWGIMMSESWPFL